VTVIGQATLFLIFRSLSLGASNFLSGQVVGDNAGFCPGFQWYATFAHSIMVLLIMVIIVVMALQMKARPHASADARRSVEIPYFALREADTTMGLPWWLSQ
jgi:hypothetical protein